MVVTPFEQIKTTLTKELSSKQIDILPDKWEKIGDVLTIKLQPSLLKYREKIGEIYSLVLDCKTVLQDMGRISGTYRTPNVKIIYGPKETETIHIENNIRYKLDPQRIMFSSGNMDERIRMANISNKKEIVVDLFAGIGYFTLPIAVYSQPKKIYACEINSVAYGYLQQNIVLNDVTSNVEALLGDNRETAPKNIADRVIMGHIRDTYQFLSTAISCLKNKSGIIHYHEVCPNELLPNRPLEKIREKAKEYDKQVKLIKYKTVKSYAPGVSHAVLDLKIG